MSEAIDWSRAGKRLRHTPPGPAHGGRNPDWNMRLKRWKVAEEYAAETLSESDIRMRVPCTVCAAPRGEYCADSAGRCMDHAHAERAFAAGGQLVAQGWVL